MDRQHKIGVNPVSPIGDSVGIICVGRNYISKTDRLIKNVTKADRQTDKETDRREIR